MVAWAAQSSIKHNVMSILHTGHYRARRCTKHSSMYLTSTCYQDDVCRLRITTVCLSPRSFSTPSPPSLASPFLSLFGNPNPLSLPALSFAVRLFVYLSVCLSLSLCLSFCLSRTPSRADMLAPTAGYCSTESWCTNYSGSTSTAAATVRLRLYKC